MLAASESSCARTQGLACCRLLAGVQSTCIRPFPLYQHTDRLHVFQVWAAAPQSNSCQGPTTISAKRHICSPRQQSALHSIIGSGSSLTAPSGAKRGSLGACSAPETAPLATSVTPKGTLRLPLLQPHTCWSQGPTASTAAARLPIPLLPQLLLLLTGWLVEPRC